MNSYKLKTLRPKQWREVIEIDRCPECGSPLLRIHNDSNITAWAKCEDCEHETELEFAGPYIAKLHKPLPVGEKGETK